MIQRYQDDYVAEVFSEEWKLNQWRHAELDYLVGRHRFGQIPKEMVSEASRAAVPSPEEVAVYEVTTGHDVVAFLAAWTSGMSTETQSQIHFGLTSSDLVDNTLFRQLWMVGKHVYEVTQDLHRLVLQLAFQHRGTVRAGRTHGQLAEPTHLGWRFGVWGETLGLLVDEWEVIEPQVRVTKTPGAVGDMQIIGDAIAQFVAEYRHTTLVYSTQVIPRQRMVAWAGWLIRILSVVEEIALEIRLSSRSEVGEMRERGAANRIGSSAMPHKRNPIGSEQLSGLARVARSHFVAIAETAGALHNERDISNSSVERLVVPDLAHIAAYSLTQITKILETLVIDGERMADNAMEVVNSARLMADLQTEGVPYTEAHRRVSKL